MCVGGEDCCAVTQRKMHISVGSLYGKRLYKCLWACWCAVHVCLSGFVCFIIALSKLACLCADNLSETMRSALH